MKGRRQWLALALVLAAAWSAVVAKPSSRVGDRVAAVATMGLDARSGPAADLGSSWSPIRLVPASAGPCLPGDLAGREVNSGPRAPDAAVSIVMTSTRACRIGGPRTITFLAADGRPASPAVVLEGGESDPVVIGPGHAGLLVVEYLFESPCLSPNLGRVPQATSARFDLAGARGRVRFTRVIDACQMRAFLESDDVFGAKSVTAELVASAPESVAAGTLFTPSLTLTYTGITTAVFDPCPTVWAIVQPQSGPPTKTVWDLDCRNMRPLRTGDSVRVPVPLSVPGDLAPQAVDIDVGFGLAPSGGEDGPTKAANTLRVEVTHAGVPPLQPVPFADSEPPPITGPLGRRNGPACTSADLRPVDREPGFGAGAGIHIVSFLLRNVSGRPCILSADTPVRLSRRGAPTFTPHRGTVLMSPPLGTGELEPDATTYVGFESGNYCPPLEPAAAAHFDTVLIELPDATLEVPFRIDEECGVSTTGVGLPGGIPFDRGSSFEPSVTIMAPATLTRGQPITIQVVLESFRGYDLGCPGYAVTIAGIETRRGLSCAVQHLLPGLRAVYDIEVTPSAYAPPGPTVLRWELLTGLVPTATAAVTLT